MKSKLIVLTFWLFVVAIFLFFTFVPVMANQGIGVTVPSTSIIWVDNNGIIQRTESDGFQPGDQLYIFDQNNNLIYKGETNGN